MIGALGKRSFLPVPTHIDGTAPLLYFDAQDYNLKRNFGVTDGGTILTHKNKGSVGSTADATQATSGQRWIFRKVGVATKLKGLSAIENDGARRMVTGTFATQSQPLLLFWVARVNGSGNNIMFGGTWEAYCSGLTPQFYAGTFQGGTASIVANTFHTFSLLGNGGAGGATRLDGAGSTGLNLGSNTLAQLTLGSDGGANFMTGFLESLLLYGGPTTNHPLTATLATWVAAKIGATPQ